MENSLCLCFIQWQVCIEMWRKGIMVLTSESSHQMEVPDGFLGTMLDFINPDADVNILSSALPVLLSNFPIFIFHSVAHVNAFNTVANQQLMHDDQIYTCALEEFESTQMDEMV